MITIDLNLIELDCGDRILDIGCGTGRHAGALYAHEKIFVVAGDKHVKDVIQAGERMEYHDRLKSHCGGAWAVGVMDIKQLPFPDECFDLVICSEVLEHIRQHHIAVDELYRILKRGGELAVSVPRYFPERICWYLSSEYRHSPGGHVRIYRRRDLVKLIEKAGFKPWRSHFAHSLHTPYWWLKCLVGPSRNDVTIIRLYERFLTWEIMQHPAGLQKIDRLLNPLMGKSLVVYAHK